MTVTEQQFERLQRRVRNLEEKLASVFLPDGSVVLSSSQRVRIVVGSSRITLDEHSITIESANAFNVQSSHTTLNSAAVMWNSGMVTVSGVVRCDTIIATTVMGTNYTPGAGNVM